ncbi:MAG: hypothetical protein ABIP97_00150 [Chthoniobacterales bacterium]
MQTALKILLAVVILICGYSLWPRTPGFTTFRPDTLARSDVRAWEALGRKQWSAYTWNNYWVLDQQFQFQPLVSFRMARNYTRAASILVNATNGEEQQKALPFFKHYFELANAAMKGEMNTDAMAKRELDIWIMTSTKSANSISLTMLSSEQWASFAGGKPREYRDAAAKLVEGALMYGTAGTTSSQRVEKTLTDGYTKLLDATSPQAKK